MKNLNHQFISPGALLVAALFASGSVLTHGAVLGTPIGDTSAQSGSFNGDALPGGSATITTTINSVDAPPVSGTSAVDAATLANFLGVSTTALNTPASPQTIGEGSGFKQTFTGLSAGTFTVNWDFYTAEGDASVGKDYAFYTLYQTSSPSGNGLTSLANVSNTSLLSNPLSRTFQRATGWQTTSINVPSAGDWVLGFGVADSSANLGQDSALGVSSVTFTAVPEPWAWSLISALALGGVALARRVRMARA
jgi:hypothetical protein